MNEDVMWITQLVVDQEHRGKGYASTLLRFLVTSCNPEVVGVASSHPHAILALKKASTSIFDGNFIQTHLRHILDICNVPYLIDRHLVGSLFQQNQQPDNQCRLQIDTGFYTDHTEPLKALSKLPVDVEWPLGPLLEGHEFVVIFLVGSNRKKDYIDST